MKRKSALSSITVQPSDDIHEANGAHAASSKFLSQKYFSRKADHPEAVSSLLLEDIGHYANVQLNIHDSHGDEDAIFSAFVRGEVLSPQHLAVLQAENDIATITLDGRVLQIEQSTIVGTDGNDTLNGTAGDDTISGDIRDDGTFFGDDTIYGGDGNDRIYGEYEGAMIINQNISVGSNDYIDGGDGNDVLNGDGSDSNDSTRGSDTLLGGKGIDSLFGYGGNDYLDGGDDNDSLDGGRGLAYCGNNELHGGSGDDTLTSGNGNDILDGGEGHDVLDYSWRLDGVSVNLSTGVGTRVGTDTIVSIEEVRGSLGSDSLIGGSGDDVLYGDYIYDLQFEGNDYLEGGPGNDNLVGGLGTDVASYRNASSRVTVNLSTGTATGGDGTDTLNTIEYVYGSGFDDFLTGDNGINELHGMAGNDWLAGGLGNDTLWGYDGNDTLEGGDGNDQLGYSQAVSGQGEPFGYGNDILLGEAGSDILFGWAGDDSLDGGTENDYLNGGSGNDSLAGDAGNDIVIGSDGNDRLEGGVGDDRLFGQQYQDPYTTVPPENVTTNDDILLGGAGNDELLGDNYTSSGNDYLDGGDGNDKLIGVGGNDTLIGGKGDDYLDGDNGISGNGNDILDGGEGQDTVIGGNGNDILTGSAGDDQIYGGHQVDFYGFGTEDWISESADTNFSLSNYQLTGLGVDSLHMIDCADLSGGISNNILDASAFSSGSVILRGEAGNDTLIGGTKDDVLIGINASDTAPGLGELDTLTGGAGADKFILGDANWIGYDDGNSTINGTGDYATITDFVSSTDIIQLQGSRSSYRLETAGSNTNLYIDKSGTEPEELIAVIQNVTGLDIHSSAFVFVQAIPSLAISTLYTVRPEGNSGSTAFTFTVTRSGDLSVASSVAYAVTGSGANAPNASDFGGTLPNGTVSFAANEASKTITINVVGDTTVESDENFTVILSNAVNGVITTASAGGTIQNDDVPPPVLAIAALDAVKPEGNSGSTAFTFTVTRSGDLSAASSVAYAVTGSGTNPVDASDFGGALPNGTVTFAANEASKTVTVNVVVDTAIEFNEDFIVTLSNPSNATITTASAGGTIQNDDWPPPALAIAALTGGKPEGNSGTTAFTFTVTRSGDTSRASTVTYAVAGNGTNAADAADFGDTLPNGTISFAANETSKTVTINVAGDTAIEPDEGFTVTLSNPNNATITTASAGGTIQNDDLPPPNFLVTTSLDAVKDTDGVLSLREAITLANNTTGQDVITFDSSLAGKTILLTSPAGQLEITDALTIKGLGADQLSIDANGNSRLLLVDDGKYSDIGVEVSGLTLTGGRVLGGSAGEDGGGILNRERLTLSNTNITGNVTSGDAGGIFNWGDISFIDSTLSNNTANGSGGGIRNQGEFTSINSIFSDNRGDGGGFIRNIGSAVLINSTVSGNASSWRGGGIWNQGEITINGSNISGNSARLGGGGIESFGGNFTLVNSTVSGNSSGSDWGGGGIYFGGAGSTASLANSTVSGNTASGDGGGIYTSSGELSLHNVTITGNSANGSGGGIYKSADYTTVILANSIVANSLAGGDTFNSSTMTIEGINLVEDGTLKGTRIINTDPHLGSLQNNGGSTLTHALLSGSLAIDAGFNGTIPADTADLDDDGDRREPIPFDQRGEGFTRIFNGKVDLGAFEVSPTTPALAIATLDAVKPEGNSGITALTFTMTRSGDLSAASTIAYAVTGSGANAADTSDFGGTLPNGMVSFAANEASKTVSVNVAGDITVEPDEGFTITLSNPNNATITTASAGGTIQNDDLPPPVLAIAVLNAVKPEGNSGITAFTFTVARSGDLSATSTVAYAVTGSGANATDASDFGGTLPNGTVSFAAGEVSKTVTVNVIGDTTIEPDENFILTLSNAVNGVFTTSSADGTIQNDDLASIEVYAGSDVSLNEGDTFTRTVIFSDGQDNGAQGWSYSIDYGDGTTHSGTTLLKSLALNHQYTAGNANRTVSVNLTDVVGETSSDNFLVTVNNVAPVSEISGADSINEGNIYNLNVGTINDPGTDTRSSYSIVWGDGSAVQSWTPEQWTNAAGNFSHTYADGAITCNITIHTTDDDGTFTLNSKTVAVNNIAPSLTATGAETGNLGSIYTLSLSSYIDPGQDTLITNGISINWGDGSIEGTNTLGDLKHIYDIPGDFNIQVSLTDEDGMFVNVARVNTSIRKASIVLTAPSPITFIDTVFDDNFATVTGLLDASGNSLTFGISGGTDHGDGTISQSSTYGLLTVNEKTGAYSFVANDAAIEALTAAAKTIFTVTVSDDYQSDNKIIDINVTQSGMTESIGNDKLTGTSGDDRFDGLAGADTMIGGLGNDIYAIDDIGDVVTENVENGVDTVNSSISYTLKANVENLTLTGTAAIDGTGNVLNNILIGNTGANILNGSAGADNLMGGAGDDTYIIDNTGDLITEQVDEGTDLIKSAISYTLNTNVENLILLNGKAINGNGNTLNNIITGNSSANILDGREGDDALIGGNGNDTYTVDSEGDNITETLTGKTGGIDLVKSSVSYTLGNNQEKLTLLGTNDISGYGNELANTIIGNESDNRLVGGLGKDTLKGSKGNDEYFVNLIKFGKVLRLEDKVIENKNEGVHDILNLVGDELDLLSATTLTLGSNLEGLSAAETGHTKLNLTGNNLDNILVGNSADNILNGGIGIDGLYGEDGNDTYLIDNTADQIFEASGQGTDLAKVNINAAGGTFVLSDNLENATLISSVAYLLTGNNLDNILIGNRAANTLTGADGNDTLQGFAGADSLIGGEGADLLIGGTGKDNYDLTELTPATDTVRIAAGSSVVSNFDTIYGFLLGTGTIGSQGVDQLDLTNTTIAANANGVNGSDKGVIHSHRIVDGLINFDDVNSYSDSLTITSGNLANVVSYLQANIKGNNLVAFNSEGNTYVFQDSGAEDILVELVGVTATSLSLTGLTADALWIV